MTWKTCLQPLVVIALAFPGAAAAQSSDDLPQGIVEDLEQRKSADDIVEGLTRGLAISPGDTESGSDAASTEDNTADQAAATQAEGERPSVALRITFEFDSDRLTGQARDQLDELARALEDPRLSSSRVRLTGHTDSRGAAAYNQSLSERRARTAARYLRERHGITAGRLETRGMGERQPMPGTDPAAGVNRRVVVTNLGG